VTVDPQAEPAAQRPGGQPPTDQAPGDPATSVAHVLVRVWLPDRPGALGLVASRIGSIGGDIVGIDVLERGEGVAVDEFAVEIADLDLLEMMAGRSKRSTARPSRSSAWSPASPIPDSTHSSRPRHSAKRHRSRACERPWPTGHGRS
jgi:UTP:GlnB (protein PII) uridylyltransferase